MHPRILVVAMLLWVAACSTPPTKEAAPGTAEAPVVPSQGPTEATTARNRAPGIGVPDPLKDPSNILSKRSVFFDYDESLIKASDRQLLQAHANYLHQHPTTKIVVQGNTDERGSREYNLALGQRRADVVKHYLTLAGAEDRQIDAVTFGKEKPRCTLNDESCWSQNRRADLVYPGD